MLWINGLICLALGIIIGFYIAKATQKKDKSKAQLENTLANTQYELDQQRRDLIDLFSKSSHLLDKVAMDYNKLYKHLATSSTQLMPDLPEQDNPFSPLAKKGIDNNEV